MITQLAMILSTWAWMALVWLSGWTIARGLAILFSRGRAQDHSTQANPADLSTAFLLGALASVVSLYGVLAIWGRLSFVAYFLLFVTQVVLAAAAVPSFTKRLVLLFGEHKGWWSVLIWAAATAVLVSLARLWGYDAQAIYGLKARLLADGARISGPDFCDPYRVHFWNNYPLLVPLLEAQVFFWRNQLASLFNLERGNDLGVTIIFWGFVLALVIRFAATSERFLPKKGPWFGLPLGLTPMIWRWTEGAGLSGSADLAVAVFIFAAVDELSRTVRPAFGSTNSLFLSGLFFGGTCLTKQEGIIWTATALFAFALTKFWTASTSKPRMNPLFHRTVWGSVLRVLMVVGIVLVPFLALRFWVHADMPSPLYARSYLAALYPEWMIQVIDRPLLIVGFAFREFLNGRWSLWWVLAAGAFLCPRANPLSEEMVFCRVLVVLMMLAHFSIFVLTPYPLRYHLYTAFARLLFHFFPLLALLTVEQLVSLRWSFPQAARLALRGVGRAFQSDYHK